MAIGTGNAIEFFGIQDNLDSTSASVANNDFSIVTDVVTPWTNDDDAPTASVTMFADWNTTAPTANSSVNLYARLLNTVSANDADVPDANFQHTYLGSFPVNDVLTNQYITITVSLPNYKTSSEYEFYIENKTGQTIVAGWVLYVTPKTIGASA